MKRAEKRKRPLLLAGLLAAILIIALAQVAYAQTTTDYAVQSEPDPLVDGTSRVGSTTDPLSNAQTQDYTYEDISEANVAAPTTTTYDFSSGASTNKWAKTNTNVDEPAAPYTTTHFDGSPPEGAWTEITYSDIASLNQVWQLADGTTGDYAALQYKLTISESPSTITNVDITQTVFIQTAGTTLGVWVWNFSTSAWVQVGTNYTVNSTASPGETFTQSITSGFSNYINASGLMYVIVVANTTNKDYSLDYIKFVVTYTPLDYRLNWEHRVTGIGSHDNYYVRIYGHADTGETFSIKVWNGSTFYDNGYNLPAGASAWVDYQIPSSWIIGGAVSIKYDDDTDGDTTAQSIHIDYCGVRGTTVGPPPPFDFSVGASPASIMIYQGDTTTSTITVALVSGTPQTVSLDGNWVGATPSGVNTNFSPPSGSPTYDSVLTFTTTQSASTGTFTYRVTGTGGSQTHTRDITLTINEVTFSFSLSASPDNLTLMRSDNATSAISLGLLVGASKTVNLSGSWVGTGPTGVSAVFSPSSGTPPFSSTLTFTTTSTASAGTFTYRVSGTGDGVTKTDDITITIKTELTLTLETDNESYEKGENIGISGTATDPKGNSVTSGTATIQLSFEGGSRSFTAQIVNGSYSYSYQISFGEPAGTWAVTVTAGDGKGNSGTETKDITVSTPPGTEYYTVTVLSPQEGLSYSRGTELTISIRLTEGGTAGPTVGGANVNFIAPTGERIPLDEIPGTGTYSKTYTLGWDAPTGGWAISAEGTKTVGGVFKAGGKNIGVQVTTASLQINLLSPKDQVEVGQPVEVRVEVLYPNGDPVEGATVTVTTPAGENLTLSSVAAGIYSRTYTPTSEGTLSINVAAADLSGNSGSKTSAVEVVPKGILAAYWWAILPAILAVGLVSGYVVRRTMFVRKLERVQKEKAGIPRLKKEAARRYYTESTITRETYIELIKKYDTRLEELKKEERELRLRVKKKGKK